jgi:hypothetical protein
MTKIKLDDDTSIIIKKVGKQFKVTLEADFSFKAITGDLSAIVARKDLIRARDVITKLLEED